MRIRVKSRRTYTIELDDGTEVETIFEPIDGYGVETVLTERIGDKLVVGYISSQSDDPGDSPLEGGTANGNIYLTGNSRDARNSIWHDAGEVYSALHIDSYGNVDIDRTFELESERVTLQTLAQREFFAATPGAEQDADQDPNGFWDEHGEKIEQMAVKLYPKHWRAIAGPFVVPISYSGDVSLGVADWDGDPNDLPDGVWVADSGAEENIRAAASGECPTTLEAQAEHYAKVVLGEVQNWANGEVYGVCIEVFEDVGGTPPCRNVGEWARIEDDACWGHIGSDWAQEALKEEFGGWVAQVRAKERSDE